MSTPISVWYYYDAPAELQISTNCGDEDWLAEVPPEYADQYILWLEIGHFACCDVDIFDHPSKPGWKIYIGSHS